MIETRAELMEMVLEETDWLEFTNGDLAEHLSITGYEASRYLNAYQDAQRRGLTNQLLHRVPGTRGPGTRWRAVWKDDESASAVAQDIHLTFAKDVVCRIEGAVKPDLAQLREHNPKAARKVDAVLTNIESAVMMVWAITDEEVTSKPVEETA